MGPILSFRHKQRKGHAMDRIFYYGAYILAGLQLIAMAVMLKEVYSRDLFFVILLMLPPLFTILALCNGPDREERKLQRQVRKARLRQELGEFGK